MFVSPKGLCLIISGWVKESRKSPCGNLLFRVRTLTSRFGVSTVFIGTVTMFCFYMDRHKIVIYEFQEMYIFYCKQGDQMPIDFHMTPHLLELYMVQI